MCHYHLSVWRSSAELSVKTCRGKRWWKDLARWGANTSVKPVQGSTSHRKHNFAASWEQRGSCFTTEVAVVTLTTHFTLHRKLCVLGMTLWTKVSSQRQVWTAAAVQVTRRHRVTDDEDAGCEAERRLTSFFTHAMLNEGLASWSVTEATVCWGNPKQTHNSSLLSSKEAGALFLAFGTFYWILLGFPNAQTLWGKHSWPSCMNSTKPHLCYLVLWPPYRTQYKHCCGGSAASSVGLEASIETHPFESKSTQRRNWLVEAWHAASAAPWSDSHPGWRGRSRPSPWLTLYTPAPLLTGQLLTPWPSKSSGSNRKTKRRLKKSSVQLHLKAAQQGFSTAIRS